MQKPCPLRKCKFLQGKNKKVQNDLKHKNMQTFSEYFAGESLDEYELLENIFAFLEILKFPSQPDIFYITLYVSGLSCFKDTYFYA